MNLKNLSLAFCSAALLLSGCASVPTANPEQTNQAKKFEAPTEGNSGLYIYRNSMVGAALKKDVYVNGKCLGETSSHMFFFTEVPAGQQDIATESEFSPNHLTLQTEAGKNYFVRQYIKMGAFVGGANLEQVSEQVGKTAIAQLQMGEAGHCSQPLNGK